MQDTVPQIIAIAGPKGGCGKTTLAVGLAQTLAERHKTVCLVDLDPYGQNATFALRLTPDIQSLNQTPARPMAAVGNSIDDDFDENDDASVLKSRRTYIPCLRYAILEPETPDLFERICALHADYVILDMPSGFRNASIFDDADISILVSTPEPASIFEATQWLHYVIESRLHNDNANIPIHNPGSWYFENIYRQLNVNEAKRFENAVASYRTFFVLNGRREGSEITQADALCHAWWRFIGADVRPLGTLRYEERRWFFTRQFSPDDPLAQDDSMQDDLNLIADRILADQWPARPCGATLSPVIAPQVFLTVRNEEEPRHAYRRLYEGYRRENSLVSWTFPRELIQMTMTQLDAAWQQIHNEKDAAGSSHLPSNSRAIETPVLTNTGSIPTSMTRRLSETYAAAVYDPQQCEPNAGDWLRACRERVGISLPTLAMKTRIAPKNLDLIEKTQIASIAPAYLQGYLFEIAKVLDLPLDELRRKFGFNN